MKKDQSVVNESYIVRIYRRDHSDPEGIIGLVEAVGTEGPKKFGSAVELLDLIIRKPATKKPNNKKHGGGE